MAELAARRRSSEGKMAALGRKFSIMSQDNLTLAYLDFLPEYQSEDEKGIPQYESFQALIDKANKKLLDHPSVKVVSCEEFQIHRYCRPWEDHDIRPDNNSSSVVEGNFAAVQEFNAFRLWVTSKTTEDDPEPVRIGVETFVPSSVEKDPSVKQPKMELLNSLVNKANAHLRSQPLNGRILNMQTHDRKFSVKGKNVAEAPVNPNSAFDWFLKEDVSSSLTILRIFYLEGPPAREVIGIKDFVPVVKGFGLKAKGEPFGKMVEKANKWTAENPQVQVTNMQSVNFKMGKAEEIKRLDTSESVFYARTGKGSEQPDLLCQILRVFFVLDGTGQEVCKPRTYKTFVPPMVRTSVSAAMYMPKFEKMNKNLERLKAWLENSGADVVGVETGKMNIRYDSLDPEATITFNAGQSEFTWLYFVRVYIEGEYEEPPAEILPPIPEPREQSSCLVS